MSHFQQWCLQSQVSHKPSRNTGKSIIPRKTESPRGNSYRNNSRENSLKKQLNLSFNESNNLMDHQIKMMKLLGHVHQPLEKFEIQNLQNEQFLNTNFNWKAPSIFQRNIMNKTAMTSSVNLESESHREIKQNNNFFPQPNNKTNDKQNFSQRSTLSNFKNNNGMLLKAYDCAISNLMDECTDLRYSQRAIQQYTNKQKKPKNQILLDSLSKDLEPPSPIKPREVAVCFHEPKRKGKLRFLQKTDTAYPPDDYEDRNQIYEKNKNFLSKSNKFREMLQQGILLPKQRKDHQPKKLQNNFSELSSPKQQKIKMTDLNQYHKISMNAKRILFWRGSQLVRKYEPQLAAVLTQEANQKKTVKKLEEVPALTLLSQTDGGRILYTQSDLKKLANNDTSIYDD